MKVPKVPVPLAKTVDINIGSVLFTPSYIQAGAIVFLLFLLVLSLARLRRMYVGWSLKGAWGMIAVGFFLALIFEGFMIIGGRTILTEVIGWKNPPKPIASLLDSGRDRLVDVLGVADEVPTLVARENPTVLDVVSIYQSLEGDDAKDFRSMICAP